MRSTFQVWMWRYSRGQPRLVTVAEAELQRKAAISDACRRAADTVKQSEGKNFTENQQRVTELPLIEVVLYSRLYTVLYSTCYIDCCIT